MEIESDLPPTWIRLQTKVLLSVTRMQSLSTRHPIHPWLADALRTRTAVTRHRSILGNVFNQFPLITKTSHHLRRITTKQGVKTGRRLYNNLPNRTSCAHAVQLRTGHCGLNDYLHRFGKKDSPTCECGHGKETVEHYLLECPNYREQSVEINRDLLPEGQ